MIEYILTFLLLFYLLFDDIRLFGTDDGRNFQFF